MSTHIEAIKAVGDVTSFTIVIGALASWLPPVASLLTIIWVCIRIYETRTVQRWLGNRNK